MRNDQNIGISEYRNINQIKVILLKMSQVVDQLKKCDNALVVYLFRDHPGFFQLVLFW